ncbi:MAG TPA: cell division protein FtsZ [Candidatus Pelagibacter sp.]|jgi:cell division protein FtsZ|nr:cell division protein FtsZ [Candidatus Pelagibacter sp.]
MTININIPELRELKPRILVLGVGGAGGNAINGMIEEGLQGVEFVAVNTDAQDLKINKAHAKIQLGANLTKGLGAGGKNDLGQASADESLNEIITFIQGSNMVFITAGMGGGTGTGASHVIARAAKELNILTVGVVTLPFSYEGPTRMKRALQGLEELKKHVDTNIVIPNQNLFKVASEKTTFEESFELSNRVLKQGVQGVTDLMTRPGLINLDFADVETIMSGMGKAMMGTGEAEGEARASEAAEQALKNPLIDEYSLKGAKGLLINITGGKDLTLFEVDEAVNKVRAEVDSEAELIIGAITDSSLDGKMRVSIVATALDNQGPQIKPVVSMVHRINNRSFVNSENLAKNSIMNQSTLSATAGATALDMNQSTLSATAGATALDMNQSPEQSLIVEQQIHTSEDGKDSEEFFDPNISIENTAYLQNIQESEANAENNKTNGDMPTFEVDSIELANPKLFSDEGDINYSDNEEKNDEETKIFEKKYFEQNSEDSETKEPEMFESQDLEDNFEIPAFLRRQKN